MKQITLLCSLMALLSLSGVLHAQYNSDVFSLKQASELYDERGFAQGKSITVDGKLLISQSNGNVSYSYPVSRYSVAGFPFETTLNYCGSVAFTAFKNYYAGRNAPYVNGAQSSWEKFHQNRPAWILGVNGFAVQLLGVSTHFMSRSGTRLYDHNARNFNDSDVIFVCDGYDFSNRMIDFGANFIQDTVGPNYVDNIRLLRADGSVLELININEKTTTHPDSRPELYTGYYLPMEANARGYAVVEYDTSAWPEYVVNHDSLFLIPTNQRAALVSRAVRYYPSDGLEYVFREWIIPFGTRPYFSNFDSLSGGKYGGPSIFYLEEINGPGQQLQYFHRTRQHAKPRFFVAGVREDSTRGRAPLWQFGDHTISYGLNSMTIQAFGRTTLVKFDKVVPGGRATETDWMPIANLGILSDQVRDMAAWPETQTDLYKAWLGYVTEIVDPMGRKTTFTYEPYVRKYVNSGFPHPPGVGGDVTLSLTNLRLKEIEEPTASYTINYYKAPCIIDCGNDVLHITTGSDTLTIRSIDGTDRELPRLSNMAARVEKRDLSGTLLTTDRYHVIFNSGSTFGHTTRHIAIDEISHDTVTKKNSYIRFELPDFSPKLPRGHYTAISQVETKADDLTIIEDTYYSSVTTRDSGVLYGKMYSFSRSKWGMPFVILDTARATSINGITRSRQLIDYTLDTVRDYGSHTVLEGLCGMDIMQRVTRTLDPLTGGTLLSTTTDYLHLPLVDTTGTTIFQQLQKLLVYKAWDSLKALGEVDPELGYEYAPEDPRTARWSEDTSHWKVRVPPTLGLERRTVVRDSSNNYLSGKFKEYDTGYNAATQDSYIRRGVLVRDSIIGAGGVKRILGGEYDYNNSRLRTRLASDVINANGALARSSPWYSFPEDLIEPQPEGKVLDNKDSIGMYPLRGSVYANMTEEPLAERRVVRRPAVGGGLDTIELTQYSERTFYGQVGGMIDYNGWFTRLDYDKNGRLATAWFPYDFQGSDSTWLHEEVGYDSSEGYGVSSYYNVYHGVVICDVNYPDNPNPSNDTITRHGVLFADYPVMPDTPVCPECNEVNEKGRDQTILALCTTPIRYDEQYPATGALNFKVVPPKTDAILSLDSAWLRLYVSSMIGNCVDLEVHIPELDITRTYVLNCPPGTGIDSGGGNYLMIDLTDSVALLEGYAPGETIGATFKVMTPGGRVEFVSGYESHDLRPQLMLKGEFRRINQRRDYTLAYRHADDSLASEITAKVDDIRHTASWHDTVALAGEPRRARSTHYFGADGRLLKSRADIREPWGALRADSVRHAYTGLAKRTRSTDQLGDSIVTAYDALGRPVQTTNQDGSTSTIAYYYDRPDSLGITDQDFHGFVTVTTATNEHGVKYTRYTDAFDRLRREVADSGAGGHLNLTTKYEYDLLGRLTMVINPKGDSTLYWYDEFGRVKKKRHPDLNVVSYAYDNLGNVRYTQSQEQANRQRLTFNQYDDLNRLVLVGEANFANFYNEDTIDISHAQANSARKGDRGAGILHSVPEPETTRYTDILDPRYLHDDDTSLILTANATLWMTPIRSVPQVPLTFAIKNCAQTASALLGETSAPIGPFIMRPAAFYNSGWMPVADTHDFEHLAEYPEFPRIAIHYDTLPPSQGPIWGGFPAIAFWNMLAPKGTVRNLRGREAVVAYRERAAEPYHFAVMSYDERGRVEALLHFTENLGFDAVYYSYNSMNQVTSVTAADLNREFTTWYGYDANGRVDTVWSNVYSVGSGLYHQPTGLTRYPGISRRSPVSADIVYRYTKTGQVDTMLYPQVDVLVDYAYNRRKWLDSLVATDNGSNLFRQILKYHPTGQIVEQQWQHGANARRKQTYTYDSVQQLIAWTNGPASGGGGGGGGGGSSSTQYTYDNVGNRLSSGLSASGGSTTGAYTYPTLANRLLTSSSTTSAGTTGHTYWYNHNGSQIRRARSFDSAAGGVLALGLEDHGWSYRELARRFVTYNGSNQMQEDWRYRPNAGGEREQKRVYWLTSSDAVTKYPWVYYQLGGSKEQLAVYHGQQTSTVMCSDTGRRVYMYPTEYLTHGVAYTGVREDVSQLITKADGTKEYRIHDHLASMRASLVGGVTSTYDYDPWGELLASTTGVAARRGYNDREEDRESGNLDLGVRKKEKDRFTNIDPLWEKFPSQSPYVYANNNPLRYTDPDGMQAKDLTERAFTGVLKGMWGVAETGAAQGWFMLCPPCGFAQQIEAALDPNTYESMLKSADAKLYEITTDNGALAEFGGQLTFNLLFYGGVSSLAQGGSATVAGGTIASGETATGANSAINGLNLSKSLAGEAQMAEKGRIIAGPGSRRAFDDAPRVAKQYGGGVLDWVKMSSSKYVAKDGTKFETHWVQHFNTGERVEFKTKMVD